MVIEHCRTGTGRRVPAGSGPVVGDRSGQALAGRMLQDQAGRTGTVGNVHGTAPRSAILRPSLAGSLAGSIRFYWPVLFWYFP